MKKQFILTITLVVTTFFGFSQELEENDVKAQFIAMLDGSEEKATEAITTFGSEEVIQNGMIPFGANPEIVSIEDNCVWFELTYKEMGATNLYYICSKGNKIVAFEWGDDE